MAQLYKSVIRFEVRRELCKLEISRTEWVMEGGKGKIFAWLVYCVQRLKPGQVSKSRVKFAFLQVMRRAGEVFPQKERYKPAMMSNLHGHVFSRACVGNR